MAYKYFSQQLLTKNLLDLSEVFPQKQEIAKEQNNVAYNLGDIVLYLQEVTENFKFTDAKYIDLDQAIKAIVNKYYVSIATKNPFDSEIEALSELEAGVVPREAAIVKEGEVKGKGVAKPAPSRVKEVIEVIEEAPKKSTPKKDKVTPAPTEAAIEKADDVKIQQFKNTLDNLQMLFDDSTLEEQQDIITSQTKRADGLEFFIEDSEGEDVSFQKEQLTLLRQFIANNSK